MNWFGGMVNPQIQFVKKYVYEILKDDYFKHEGIVERVAGSLTTEKDLEAFGKLIANLYESGYMESLKQQKDILAKAGVQVAIRPAEQKEEPKDTGPLFHP